MTPALKLSGILLWVLAPLLLGLSLWRPMHQDSHRAERFARELKGFKLHEDLTINPRQQQLLGTQDAAWRVYRDDADERVFVTCVFHESNWKSLHPPHICLRGSNMDIQEDGSRSLKLGDRQLTVGRIVAQSRTNNLTYLGFYAFVGRGFVTPSYVGFFLQHAPRAVFRSATPGFLIRVETYVGPEGLAAAEERCLRFLRAAIPQGESLIR